MSSADIGLIGLAVMGSNLALNIAEKGYTHRGPQPHRQSKIDDFMVDGQGAGARRQGRPEGRPRRVHPGGQAPALDHHHGQGRQAGRRDDRAAAAAARAGRRHPRMRQLALHRHASAASTTSRPRASAISASAFRAAKRARATAPRSWSAAPRSSGRTPSRSSRRSRPSSTASRCCAYLGEGGAGHFVKTIHNGIEYGDMQMIAEVYGVMRDGLGMNPAAASEVFKDWNKGPLNSYLIEITGHVLAAVEPKTGKPLVELILDKAGQKGTGVWSAIAAQQLGVPATAIEGAVAARSISSRKDERVAAEAVYGKPARRQGRRLARRSRKGAARRQDRLLRAGLCRDGQGLRGERLEPAARDHRQDLARRLHHPLALPRPDVGGLRQGRRDQPADGARLRRPS